MRLRTLDLIRYGRFTDRVLDFGPGGGETDVTIVYGGNEAGKSTAFHAWLDLLFGLPLQHPYDFLHARKDMMVGATLEIAEGPLLLRRTGQRNGSLTDQNGREVDERRLALLLHGLDRASYRTRFSLNNQVLLEGGAEIAAAKGDLGQLLHAGSSGLSGLAQRVSQAEEAFEAFHKPRGRTTILAEAKRRLAEIDQDLAEQRMDPARFTRLRQAREAAEAEVKRATEARDAAGRALALRQAADQRRALARRIAAAEDALEAFPAGPDLPPEAVTQVTVAAGKQADAVLARGAALAAAQEAEERLAGLASDPEGLQIAALLADLDTALFDDGQPLVSRATNAEADIARRRAELETAKAELKRKAAAIGGEGADPAALILPRETIISLRGAALALVEAVRARQDAARRLAAAQAELGAEEVLPEGADELADALDALDRLPDDPAALARALHERQTEAARRAAGLPEGWREVAAAGLPSDAELRRIERDLNGAEDDLSKQRKALSEAEELLADLIAKADAETAAAGIVTDAAIAATRDERDRLWLIHRAALDATTAEAFETAMRADDAARSRYGETVESRARLALVEAEILRQRGRVQRLGDEVTRAEAACATPRQAFAALAARLGLDANARPEEAQDRLARLREALDAAVLAEAAETAAADARLAREAATARVAAALQALGVTPPADPIPEARRRRAALDETRARIASRARAAGLVATMATDLAALKASETDAETQYRTWLADLWCRDREPEALLGLLDPLADLAEAQREAEDLARRVDLLAAAIAAFEARAVALRDALGTEGQGSIAETLRVARDRAGAAGKIEGDREKLAAQRDSARADAAQQDRIIAAAAADVEAILAGQETEPDANPVTAVARLAERDRQRSELAGLRAAYHALAADHDPEALAEEEADADPIRTDSLKEALAEAEQARDAALDRRGEARNAETAALARTGSGTLAQERAGLIEELREQARTAALTRIGLMAAAGALRRLREERRGPMLAASEHAFARLTAGEWQRLETRPAGSGEQLVGLRNGAAVTVENMSTGTRGQLYLALRVAGHADFVSRYGALPFITDDILETFDDTRARAALAIAGEIGRIGQAILFTHHRHLVELGREAIPDLQVIELN